MSEKPSYEELEKEVHALNQVVSSLQEKQQQYEAVLNSLPFWMSLVETQLKKQESRLQAVFDSIQEPLILMRSDATVEMANQAAKAYYGKSTEHMVGGRPCFAVFHDRIEPCKDCLMLQAVKNGQHTAFQQKGFMNRRRTEYVTVFPFKGTSGQENSAIVRIQDITFKKQMDQELLEVDKMISLGILVAGVAHEINNPNNLIMFNTSLIRDVLDSVLPLLEKHYEKKGDFEVAGMPYSDMKTEIPSFINSIEKGSRRIQQIIQDLIEYARPEKGKKEESVHINDIIKEAMSIIHGHINQNTQRFSISLDRDLPMIKGNKQRLEQVIINLIQNACHFLTDPQQEIQVSTSYDPESLQIVVVVKDQGTGISDDDLPHIMDPFYTTRRHKGGTGLGLSICARIVKEHGGRIAVQSEPGKGSTFTVYLPVEKRLEQRRIMIIDDDSAIRKLIHMILARNDQYLISEASTGAEASIELLAAPPDLALVDMFMTDMNGVEICRLIKKHPKLSHVKVIIITGFMDSPVLKTARAMGFNTVISKPFDMKELVLAVEQALLN